MLFLWLYMFICKVDGSIHWEVGCQAISELSIALHSITLLWDLLRIQQFNQESGIRKHHNTIYPLLWCFLFFWEWTHHFPLQSWLNWMYTTPNETHFWDLPLMGLASLRKEYNGGLTALDVKCSASAAKCHCAQWRDHSRGFCKLILIQKWDIKWQKKASHNIPFSKTRGSVSLC